VQSFIAVTMQCERGPHQVKSPNDTDALAEEACGVVDVFAPFLTALFNRSLSLGVVPSGFKAAYITPRLKKSDLDLADVKSFRPISNLTVLSKLLERLVARC